MPKSIESHVINPESKIASRGKILTRLVQKLIEIAAEDNLQDEEAKVEEVIRIMRETVEADDTVTLTELDTLTKIAIRWPDQKSVVSPLIEDVSGSIRLTAVDKDKSLTNEVPRNLDTAWKVIKAWEVSKDEESAQLCATVLKGLQPAVSGAERLSVAFDYILKHNKNCDPKEKIKFSDALEHVNRIYYIESVKEAA